MAAPSAWQVYDQFLNHMGEKELDLSSDSFKVAFYTSASDCGNKAHSTAKYADFTNEVAAANGYTTGGFAVPSTTWINSSGTQTFSGGAVLVTASGGNIVARLAVIYDNTDTNKRAVAYCVLDNTPANVTFLNGVPQSLVPGPVFTLARAA